MNYFLKQLKENHYNGLFRKQVTIGGDNVKAYTKEQDGKTIYMLRVKFADYNSIDNSRDRMIPGCFTESIENSKTSRRKIAFCWQHDKKDPIGKIIAFDDTDKGCFVEVQLSDFEAVPNAKRAWHQVLDGVIDQASFGYNYVWDSVRYIEPPKDSQGRPIHDEQGYWEVGKVILWEVSLVTFGDNENTGVEEYSEEQRKGLTESFLKKENVIKALTSLGDEEVKHFLKEYGIEIKEETKKRGMFK